VRGAEKLEFDILAMLLLFLVILFVGISLVTYFGVEIKSGVPNQLKGVYDQFTKVVFQRLPYNVCDAYNNERVSVQDFQILIQAIYNGQCGTNKISRVTMSFSVSKDDLQKIASLAGIANNGKLIFYNTSEPIGIGAVLVKANPGFYPLKLDDEIELSLVGQPKGDLFIKLLVQGCDPFDDDCDATCIYRRICDPVCDDGRKHDISCNLACIDINKNNTVDVEDAGERVRANKCNPDCYVNYTNPYKAYDPGCVWKFKNQNDDVCDPNSNGIIDGVCDPDCPNSRNICDPDCNGEVSDGNPYGLTDEKCFKCDQTCNGWCSPACDKDAEEGNPGYDPDCRREKDKTFFCSGDLFCDADRGESCSNSADCPGGGVTCNDYNPQNVCCPQASDADYAGCSPTRGLKEGEIAACSTQCAEGLIKDETNHCCPAGKTWNGTSCEFQYTFTILFIQLNGQISNFKQKAESGKDLWVQLTPLKQCPKKVRAIAVDDKVCSGIPNHQPVCQCFESGDNCNVVDGIIIQTLQKMEDCAKQWGYEGKYTRIEGVLPGEVVCSGSRSAIYGYTQLHDSRLVSAEDSIRSTSSHEMGHTYGLCDEPYGIERSASCSSGWKAQGEQYCCPNVPDGPCIMCSYTNPETGCNAGSTFAQDDYRHLELELIQINKYCG